MKNITTHHDGHGLNEHIQVKAIDEPGPGGAHHAYEFWAETAPEIDKIVGWLQFQTGPRLEPGSTSGVTTEAVLAALIDHIEEFQAGDYPSEENVQALDHLRAAKYALRRRTEMRAMRGVLGTHQR